MSPIVVGRGVSHELATGRRLFSDLHFELYPRRAALVGPNGIGKSSLASIIAGEVVSAAGSVRRHGSVTLLPQRVVPPKVSVAEYLADEYEWSPHAALLLADISSGALCSELSGGEWMRLRLAQALRADYLILDEPTNDLDRHGRQIVYEFLSTHSRGVLLISHDRECLQRCDEVFELSNQGLARYGGGWSGYLEHRDRELASAAAALELAKRERHAAQTHRAEQQARQERRNRRGAAAAARGGAPKILLGARKRRAQATTGKVDRVTLEHADAAVQRAHAAFAQQKQDARMNAELLGTGVPAQKLIAEAHDFNLRYDDWIFGEDLNFTWRGNVRIALMGPNGAGKSSLLRALAGAQYVGRGALRRGDVRTLYLDQRCSTLIEDRSVLDNLRAVSARTETELRNALARFLFTRETVFQPVHTLSGGERLRAALALGVLGAGLPELLLLDEPTNNLDLANIEFLETFVSEFPGAIVVVSHDVTFLENCRIEGQLMLSGRQR